jgi:hypothetical protein
MATKDLSRTVLEAGRHHRNSQERRASHACERAATRSYLAAVRRDVEIAYDADIEPKPRVTRGFDDKLGPARRWLARQVGRRWDAVFAEICARFDTRTVAGRHIVHDHLLRMVSRDGDLDVVGLVVDDQGILRAGRWYPRTHRTIRKEVDRWRAGRRVAWYRAAWWWFEVARDEAATPWHPPNVRAVRPLRPLGCGETTYFERLPAGLQRGVGIALDRVEVLRARRR